MKSRRDDLFGQMTLSLPVSRDDNDAAQRFNHLLFSSSILRSFSGTYFIVGPNVLQFK